MTLREITDTTLEQICDACGRVRSTDLEDLKVGAAIATDLDTDLNADVIPLPKCDQCGAVEFLIPTPEDAPDYPTQGSFGHKHAILVDVLFDRLVQRDQVTTGIEASKLKKKKRNKDELDRWFKDGLRLPAPTETSTTNGNTNKDADKQKE